MTPDHDALAGQLLADRYRLVEMIGRGGIGTVWRTVDGRSGAELAIKVVSATGQDGSTKPTKVGRFLREARAMAKLRSPHIVTVMDHDSCPDPRGSGELVYLTMELLTGESLRDHVRRVGRVEPRSTVRIMNQVGRAVGLAHQRGIVHRDLKPANIFLANQPGGGMVCKVLDFGMAKSLAAPLATIDQVQTEFGRPLGTPYYMSPEQARGLGNVDHRSDLWALGVIAFECLCGVRPFRASSLAGLFAAIAAGPVPLPSDHADVPPGFDAWFTHAVDRDVQRRFQSAKVMVEELQEVLVDATTMTAVQAVSASVAQDVLQISMAPPGFGERTLLRAPKTTHGTSFVPRDELVRQMSEALESHCRVITLQGPRGAGRCRLAHEFATAQMPQFGGGVWRCPLHHVDDPSAMWRELASTLDAQLSDGDPGLRIGRALAGLGRVLMVLEGVDAVRAPLAQAIGRWLTLAPDALFVVTTNRELDLPTERVVNVNDLRYPSSSERGSLVELKAYPAVALLLRRAVAFDPAIMGADDSADAFGTLARLAGGSPLALELLAARLDQQPIQQVAEGVVSRALVHLGGTAIIQPDAVLAGVVRWVLEQITPSERATLLQLSVFGASFSASAAEAVVDLGALDEAPPVADLTQGLVRRGLLRHSEDRSGEQRFDLHPAIRRVAAEALAEGFGLGEGAAHARRASERHGRYYAQLGSADAIEALWRRGGWVRRGRYFADSENVALAASRAIGAADAEVAASCSLALAAVELMRNRPAAANARLVATLALPSTPPTLRLRCLVAQGRSLSLDGRVGPARQALEQAWREASQLGDHRAVAAAMRVLAEVERSAGDPSRARSLAQQAADLASQVGDRGSHAEAQLLVAEAHAWEGRSEAASELLTEAAATFRQDGAPLREAQTLALAARVAWQRRDRGEAAGLLESAASIFRELGDRLELARLLLQHGELAVEAGDPRGALELLEQAAGRSRELGACDIEGAALASLANAHAQCGDPQRGWSLLSQGEQLLTADAPRGSLALLGCLCHRAQLELRGSSLDAARSTLQRARALCNELGPLPPEPRRVLDLLQRQLASG